MRQVSLGSETRISSSDGSTPRNATYASSFGVSSASLSAASVSKTLRTITLSK